MKSDARSARHEELAHFLKTRRMRLPPARCGLRALRARRRTPGLRREEVSAIAGISTAYYTWIEQGRIFDISVDVLDGIADALRLSEVEIWHLYTLAGRANPAPRTFDDARTSLAMIDWCADMPAVALTPWLDVVEANPAAPDSFEIERGVNLASWFFAPTGANITSIKGDNITTSLVALLRRNRARDVHNAHFSDLVTRLRCCNATFRTLWDAHVVDVPKLFDVVIEHRRLGRRSFHGTLLCEPIAARWFVLFMVPSPP